MPETLNSNHSIEIVASELDASSERIVRYLANERGVAINTALLTVFEENSHPATLDCLATEFGA